MLFHSLDLSLHFFKQVLVFSFNSDFLHSPPIPRRRQARNNRCLSRDDGTSTVLRQIVTRIFEREPRPPGNIKLHDLHFHRRWWVPLCYTLRDVTGLEVASSRGSDALA